MKRLINAKLFCVLEKMHSSFEPSEKDLKSIYDDFVHKVIQLCISEEEDVYAYFTIHYTRLELEGFWILLSDEGTEKKCFNSKLHCSLPIVPIHCSRVD